MASLMESRHRILLNTPHLETVSGSIAHFSTDMASKLKELKVNFLPQQAGSGDPSPSNVRAISGWNSVKIMRCGKNLYDEANYPFTNETYIYGDRGDVGTNSVRYKSTIDFIPFEAYAGKTITLNKCPGGANPGFGFYSDTIESSFISGERNANATAETSWTITVPEGTKYMRFTVPIDATDIQLELGSESTEYEPYQSNQITVSWQDLGTIYGGYVDVLRGELVQEYSHIVVDGENITIINISTSTPDRYRWNTATKSIPGLDYGSGKQAVIMSSNMPCTENATSHLTSILPSISAGGYNAQFFIAVPLDYPSTVEDANAWLKQNPIDVVYKLATPITYPLTPETIKAIKGVNNVWSDAGDVSVKYWTH